MHLWPGVELIMAVSLDKQIKLHVFSEDNAVLSRLGPYLEPKSTHRDLLLERFTNGASSMRKSGLYV
jgi:hypothetical protein